MADRSVHVVIELTPVGKALIRFARTCVEHIDELPQEVIGALRDLQALVEEQTP